MSCHHMSRDTLEKNPRVVSVEAGHVNTRARGLKGSVACGGEGERGGGGGGSNWLAMRVVVAEIYYSLNMFGCQNVQTF